MNDTDIDGHYRDTGPQSLPELPPLVGRGVESPAVTAWRAYLEHVESCQECNARVQNCETGKPLWEAYKALHPLPTWIGRRDGSPTAPGRPA